MTARAFAVAATVICATSVPGCRDPDWRESREPVWTTDYGGSVEPDITLQYDAPMRTIYDAPPDLALRPDSALGPATSADSVLDRSAAGARPQDLPSGPATDPDSTRSDTLASLSRTASRRPRALR